MIEPVIRPLKQDGAEEFARLARTIWHAHYPGIISTAQIDFMLAQRYTPEAIRAGMNASNWDGAWISNRLVGFAQSFADAAPASWKLDKLYVHPDFQRHGIGRALLGQAKRRALAAGADKLVLRVNKSNAIALAAYAKYGFRITGEDVLEIGQGYVMDDFLMELDLCS